MTKRLYMTDSYIKEFEAKVTEVIEDKHAVVLDQTAFYPGGGGQGFDTGEIIYQDTNLPVRRAKIVDGKLLHILDEKQTLPHEGGTVCGKINWERRYQLMRTHTAMHILCGRIFRDYGVLATGSNMDPLKGRMDFEFENLSGEFVQKIEGAMNEEVKASRPVKTAIHTREEAFKIPDLIRTKINLLPPHITEVRTVEIVGLDLQADGGTHVKNTSEVGQIQITDYKSKGKINKRIYFTLEP